MHIINHGHNDVIMYIYIYKCTYVYSCKCNMQSHFLKIRVAKIEGKLHDHAADRSVCGGERLQEKVPLSGCW